jgi:hypothetical protein
VVVAIPLRDKLARLEKTLRGNLESFELRDGTRYYFDRGEAYGQAFLFFSDSMRSAHSGEPRPEPPEVLQAVAGAKDREDALSRALGGFAHLLPVDRDVLIQRGVLQPRSLVAGVELGAPLEDLSE